MSAVKSFRDLRIYQSARSAAATVFDLSKSFPPEERFELTDQIRRSALATKAMIAEAWALGIVREESVNVDEALFYDLNDIVP